MRDYGTFNCIVLLNLLIIVRILSIISYLIHYDII